MLWEETSMGEAQHQECHKECQVRPTPDSSAPSSAPDGQIATFRSESIERAISGSMGLEAV